VKDLTLHGNRLGDKIITYKNALVTASSIAGMLCVLVKNPTSFHSNDSCKLAGISFDPSSGIGSWMSGKGYRL